MSRVCTICAHPEREAVETAMVAGEANRRIAAHHAVSEQAVRRHKAEHLPVHLAKASEAAEVAQADDLLGQVRDLQARTLAILEAAESTREHRTALAAIREARSNLELLAKLVGELDERPRINLVLIDPRVRDAIVAALTPYRQARLAVANALEPFEDSEDGS